MSNFKLCLIAEQMPAFVVGPDKKMPAFVNLTM
jgi:hypothetical protein